MHNNISSFNRTLNLVTQVLVIVGALNWGFVGAFNINLVKLLFGEATLTLGVYSLVGTAGIFQLYGLLTTLSRSR